MQEVLEMREETRLQAVNTIIMASNLGQRGRTIQVLAKEMNALSEQTSELVSDVEVLQLAVNQKVEKLCKGWDRSFNGAGGNDLEAEINGIDDSYREVEKGFAALSVQIDSSCGHIERVHGGLQFIQHLQDGLRSIAVRVEQARDTLLPWRELASSGRGEINQLIQRYTMEQERLIHMFDRVEAKQARQGGEDIFF
jgi:methyl-accepting chemotaxis protein